MIPNRGTNFRTFVSIELIGDLCRVHTEAFLDSGAVENFMDDRWAKENNLPICTLPRLQQIMPLDGRPLGSGLVKQATGIIQMNMPFAGHTEHIRFFIVDSPAHPVVLGHAWLIKHKPHIDWGNSANPVMQWG